MQQRAARRQPVHTVYGGAHLFRSDTAARLGAAAMRVLETFAPDAASLAAALELPADAVDTIYSRVTGKLRREPVEDFRLDFEDGYGYRPDAEEDGHAVSAAHEVATGFEAQTLPPFIGIRIKPLNAELRERAERTLQRFVSALLDETSGRLPPQFVITLPKITSRAQVESLAALCTSIEHARGLQPGALRLELMVETPESIFDAEGRASLPALVQAGGGRVTAAHFGTYDYTASLGITAAFQHMRHPACDFARHVMQVSLAGTDVWLSDGATNVLPVAVHRPAAAGALTAEQHAENRVAVHRAWKLHYDDIRHSLTNGFYQGWDLHPAQLVTRYAAVFRFFLESLQPASERLRNFIAVAARATLVGEVFDDAATGQGLLNYFLRALNCGAVGEDEIEERTGLALDELRSGSFVSIVKGRLSR